jgi:DNA-binding transcriptional regulator YdaS (Cro superfamily)
MTAKTLDLTLRRLDLPRLQAAQTLGVSKSALDNWCTGERPIPAPVAILVTLLDRGKLTPADCLAAAPQ